MPIVLVLTLLISSLSFATMTVGNVDCPQQFEGRVEEIIKSVPSDRAGTITAFATQAVIFKNLSTIKGKVSEQVSVEVLEHGPFEIERGEDYRVQLREGRVCWVEKL